MNLTDVTNILASAPAQEAIDVGLSLIPDPTAQAAARIAIALLPTASALLDKLGAGTLTTAQVQAEWLRNQALYAQGRKDWDAAAGQAGA